MMLNTSKTSAEVLHDNLLDVQHNLNTLIRQLSQRKPGTYRAEGAAALMAAMAYKLTQLSRTLHH